LNVKPTLTEDVIVNVPAIVNVWILIASDSPVNVTIIPDGIVIEQSPDGIIPLTQVVESLNAPD
jgi:hypothetical protein